MNYNYLIYGKNMANFKESIKREPLQAILTAIAVAGVVLSLFNFYLLANISPIETRVAALEQDKITNSDLVPDVAVLKEKTTNIEKTVSRIEDKIDTLQK